jgi:hypothetical protein
MDDYDLDGGTNIGKTSAGRITLAENDRSTGFTWTDTVRTTSS